MRFEMYRNEDSIIGIEAYSYTVTTMTEYSSEQR